MKSENKTTVILIVAIIGLVAIYFIFVKPDAADPILTGLNAILGFFLGAVGALFNTIKI